MEIIYLQLRSVLQIDRLYSAFTKRYDADFNFPGESHDVWELGAVLSGCAGITSGAEVYECTEGEMVLHPPGAFHTAWAKGGRGVEILTVSFTVAGGSRYLPQGKFILNPEERQMLQLLCGVIREHIREIDPTKVRPDPEAEQMLKNYLEILCLSLSLRGAKTARPQKEKDAALFAEAVGYMQARVDDALTVEDICTGCGIGRTVMKELFRRYAYTGVMKYYNHLRLRRIISLLEEGESVGQIAEKMHFSSQNYLTDFFRRGTGVPPSRYFDR
jgi:AraC-like DNA-binding protein